MGNICSDNPYTQIKELHPKEFQKLVEAHELQKRIGSNFNQSQQKLNSTIAAIEKQELTAISSKKNQVKEHYEKVKQDVDKSYPGGISFLQKGKNAKIEELLQYNLVEKQYSDITENIKTHIAEQKLKANTQLIKVKDQELKKLQDSKPVIKEFSALREELQADTMTQGVKEYGSQIEEKTKNLTDQISKKLGFESVFQRCKSLVPADKLFSLTAKTKENITKIAASFIGHPSEGKATLF